MKITDSPKAVLRTEDSSGKATASAFAAIMNLLIEILTKLGLLKKDLDYHLVRASMVIIYFFFGYQKWFPYEAQGPVGFWGFRNGYLARSCSWDSGTKS